MLILLPPSEGKTDPGAGTSQSRKPGPLDLATLTAPDLMPFRLKVAKTLVAQCQSALSDTRKLAATRKSLGLTPSMDHEIVRNAELFEASAYPAHRVYTGVLFAAADFGSLTATERRVANSRIRVASALFGLVALSDRIPPYRLNADAKLPGLGTLKSAWRKVLDPLMPELLADKQIPSGLIVDLRSGSYMAKWPIPKELHDNATTVKIWQRGPGDTRTAVSHFNKATKGELARLLATTVPAPRSFEDLIEVCTLNSWDVQLNLAGRPQLDVLIEP